MKIPKLVPTITYGNIGSLIIGAAGMLAAFVHYGDRLDNQELRQVKADKAIEDLSATTVSLRETIAGLTATLKAQTEQRWYEQRRVDSGNRGNVGP